MSIINRFKFYVMLPARVRRAAILIARNNGRGAHIIRRDYALNSEEFRAATIWACELNGLN